MAKATKVAKQTKQYNHYPASVVNESLKRGESKRFQILSIARDTVTGERIYPTAVNVPSVDRIYLDNGESYDIAAVKRERPGGKVETIEIWFRSESAGQLILNGDKAEDRELFEFLTLSNFNESNPNRDLGVSPIYKFIDPVKEAKSKIADRKELRQAVALLDGMKDKDVIELALSRGWKGTEDINVLRDKVEAFAMDKPGEFLKSVMYSNKAILATLNEALQQQVVKFDGRSHKFSWASTGEAIVPVPRTSDKMEAFVAWVINDDKGETVLAEIKKQLKKG